MSSLVSSSYMYHVYFLLQFQLYIYMLHLIAQLVRLIRPRGARVWSLYFTPDAVSRYRFQILDQSAAKYMSTFQVILGCLIYLLFFFLNLNLELNEQLTLASSMLLWCVSWIKVCIWDRFLYVGMLRGYYV